VGGGDGTVMWVVHEMLEHSCNISQTPVGIVPFGTGNDLARVLGKIILFSSIFAKELF